VLRHIVLFSGVDQNAYSWRVLAHHGQEAVAVFFILSGYAITKSLSSRPQHLSSFLIARFWRIYPVYLVGLAIGIGVWCYVQLRGGEVFADLSQMHLETWDQQEGTPLWLHTSLHLFQLHGVVPSSWLPHADTSLVAPAWSLATEFQFYLIAPLLFIVLENARQANRLLPVSLLLVALIWANCANGSLVSPANILRYVDLFVLGMLGAMAHEYRFVGKLSYSLGGLVVAASSLQIGRLVVATAVVVWLLFWWLSATAWVERSLDTRLGRLGRLAGAFSYPLYLIHYPLARLLLLMIGDLLPGGRQLFLVVWIPATLALSYGGALLLHRYAEIPGTRYGKHLADRYAQRLGASHASFSQMMRNSWKIRTVPDSRSLV
jgi:peptidoglycan/LPS O-acetylase OafA/YrhL